MFGHADGAALVDDTPRGLWLSLWGVAMALGIGIMGSARFHALAVSQGEENAATLGSHVVSDAWGALFAHAAGIVVILLFARRRRERFALFVASVNWSWAVLSSALLVPFIVFWTALARGEANGAVDGATALFLLVILAIVVVARYRIVRIVFDMDRSRAFSLSFAALLVEQVTILALAT